MQYDACYLMQLTNQNSVALILSKLTSSSLSPKTRQGNQHLPPTSIRALVARNLHFSVPPISHSTTRPLHIDFRPSSSIRLILLISLVRNPSPNSKWHQKLQRRSPPRARHQPAKPPLRRRRLARRPQPPLATRRSASRRGRRPTPPTSTKVCLTRLNVSGSGFGPTLSTIRC